MSNGKEGFPFAQNPPCDAGIGDRTFEPDDPATPPRFHRPAVPPPRQAPPPGGLVYYPLYNSTTTTSSSSCRPSVSASTVGSSSSSAACRCVRSCTCPLFSTPIQVRIHQRVSAVLRTVNTHPRDPWLMNLMTCALCSSLLCLHSTAREVRASSTSLANATMLVHPYTEMSAEHREPLLRLLFPELWQLIV